MKNLSVVIRVTFILSVLLLSSCAGAKLSNIWEDNAYVGHNPKNVLVVGIADLVQDRIMFENTFVKKFHEHGIKATSLSSISSKKEITRDDYKKTALRLGCDAIFVTELVDVIEEEVTTTVNQPLDMEPAVESLPDLFYRREKRDKLEKHFIMENKLYDSSNGKLIWKARSDSVNSGSMKENIESVSSAVMKNLRAGKLISK